MQGTAGDDKDSSMGANSMFYFKVRSTVGCVTKVFLTCTFDIHIISILLTAISFGSHKQLRKMRVTVTGFSSDGKHTVT